jgi:hypothetical protein
MTQNQQIFTTMQQPKHIGYWVLYEQAPQKVQFAMYYKPTDEQIKNTEELLGWKWIDA